MFRPCRYWSYRFRRPCQPSRDSKLLEFSLCLHFFTRLLDNVALVCIFVVASFSGDFSELRGLRSRGFQLQAEWTYRCGRKCNDLPKVSKVLPFYLFADDTNIYFESSNLLHLQKTMNKQIRYVTVPDQSSQLNQGM